MASWTYLPTDIHRAPNLTRKRWMTHDSAPLPPSASQGAQHRQRGLGVYSDSEAHIDIQVGSYKYRDGCVHLAL